MDAVADELLDLLSGARADALDHRPALPDHDLLLGAAGHDQIRANADQVVAALVELDDLHRHGVRKLPLQAFEDRFADQLCANPTHRPSREVILWIQGR